MSASLTDYRLLTSQKNIVLELIVEHNLDPADFRWLDGRTVGSSTQISHLLGPLESYFHFDRDSNGKFIGRFSPGAAQRVDTRTAHQWNNFKFVREWLACLKREIESPDLWALVGSGEKGVQALVPVDEYESDRFSSTEVEEIRKGIGEIKEFLFTIHQVDREQAGIVELRLNYLVEASTRLGRTDWKNVAFSTLVSIILFLALPPTTAGELFRFAVVALRHVLGGPGPGLLPQ